MIYDEQHYTLQKPKFETPVKLLLAVAPYYRDITNDLIAGATGAIAQVGGIWELVELPGALELPTAIGIAGRLEKFDGYVALGCVIRGETSHYETVCNDSSRGLTLLGLQGMCIGNGILTVETRMQAELRADPKGQNKGAGAANAALHLISLSRRWSARRKGIGFRPVSHETQIAGGYSKA